VGREQEEDYERLEVKKHRRGKRVTEEVRGSGGKKSWRGN
jgi:hypothetical protein